MVRVAVLGGSKGCARAMIVQGLKLENSAAHEFKLLIRNTDRLKESYTAEQISQLTIIQGDALDINAVKQTIIDTDVVVFSVGSAFNLAKRKMIQPGLCENAMIILLRALEELSLNLPSSADDDAAAAATTKRCPKRLVAVSSTGLDGMKEVPLLLQPLYRFLLHEPHTDKLAMEKLIEQNRIQGLKWTIVRPSLLTEAKSKGRYRANVGISGYTISREDVGHFLLHQCIPLDSTWTDEKVVVTY